MDNPFDSVADKYAYARPGYPQLAIDCVCTNSGVPPGGRVLEIGCGPGTATLPFAQRGYKITCVEPSSNMIRVAKCGLAAWPNVRFIELPFEEWTPDEGEFHLAVCATAFHWLEPVHAFRSIATALQPRGTLALLWNVNHDLDTPVYREINAAYKRWMPPPGSQANSPRSVRQRVADTEAQIGSSGWFEPPSVYRFEWGHTYTAAEYLDLLDTYSDHRRMPEAARTALFTAITDAIIRNGGSLYRPYTTVLYLATVL